MALRVNVSSLSRVSKKGEISVKLTFRDITFSSKAYRINGEVVNIDESFYWSIDDAVKADDCLQLQVFLLNRYSTKRLLGLYSLPVGNVLSEKSSAIDDFLFNFEKTPLDLRIQFHVSYISPESGPLQAEKDDSEKADKDYLSIDIAEDSISTTSSRSTRARSISLTEKPRKERFKRRAITFSTTAVKSIGKSLGLSKRSSDEPLLSDDHSVDEFVRCESVSSHRSQGSQMSQSSTCAENMELLSEVIIDMEKLTKMIANDENASSITTPVLVKRLSEVYDLLPSTAKAQFYQLAITVVDAQELPGTNLDPFIVVQVDDQKKHTTVKESTSTPYYNEYFAFDFNLNPSLLFDKIITISAYHSRNILRSDKMIGSFKLDIGTVFKQPDHQFYHKWAVLTNPDDLYSPIKGVVRCDIAVIGKGYNALTSSARVEGEETEENIADNLLLPIGVPAERPAAKFTINVYRADGLPRFSSGFFTGVKKILSSSQKQLVSPYVVISFAGLTGKTSVRKKSRSPIWNEKIMFYELFPPLFQRIKIEIRDSQTGSDHVIATHYLSLSSISNEGAEGFLPTFGPSFLHFYGSQIGFDEVNSPKDNDAFGVCYRGRLLLSVSTEIIENNEQAPKGHVSVESIPPINENMYGKVKDFLAFISIYESTMIPRKYGDKKIWYEISVGNPDITCHGTDEIEEGGSEAEKLLEDIAEEPEIEDKKSEESTGFNKACNFRTKKYKSVSSGCNSFHLPIESENPCLYITTSWPDNRRRVYNSNVLGQIADNLELGILDVEEMIRMERSGSERRMRGVYEELLYGCNKYLALAMGSGGASGGRTKLDKERMRIVQRGMDRIAKDIKESKLLINQHNLKEKVRLAKFYLSKIREITENPQHGIPDVFLWMVVGGKKVAYSRLLAKNYVFSLINDESGKNCGKLHSIYFQVPGKPEYDIVNKLDVYIWYGLLEHKQHFTKGLMRGYENVDEIQFADNMTLPPPKVITYSERHVFQLRAHVYQARSLIAADDSGLSDPYAKVYFSTSCLHTQVVNETLSPIWDEMLVFDEIILFGQRSDLKRNPPSVVIEIFDEDKRGTDDFIGRAIATPATRFADEPYETPNLCWVDLWRGREEAGQVLAAFELIQISEADDDADYPKLLPVSLKSAEASHQLYSIPAIIRPTLSKYKLEVFFWGVRDLRKTQFSNPEKPRVDVDCCGQTLSSTTISSYRKNPNFNEPLSSIDLKLPDQDIYCPPITIRVVDCRAFGRHILLGSHTIKSILKYIYKDENSTTPTVAVLIEKEININPKLFFAPEVKKSETKEVKVIEGQKKAKEEEAEEVLDWWSRYYASKDSLSKHQKETSRMEKVPPHMYFKIFPCELENAFEYQSDFTKLELFELTRGKQNPDDEDASRCVGLFRGAFCLYKHPISTTSAFELTPPNEPIKVLLRVYIIKATDLCPTDMGGKADPYVVVTLNNKKQSNRDNYQPNQLNPVFGKCFEFEATFPQDWLLNVQVKDFDLIGSNEMIGETKIDLEARFYSPHRFSCGIAKVYETKGANRWRDSVKPSHILISFSKFLKANHVFEKDKVKIGNVTFTFKDPEEEKLKAMNEPRKQQKLLKRKTASNPEVVIEEKPLDVEQMSIAVLNNWEKAFGYSLCSEHIETRPLYHPDKPGVERGQIEMWIDMFPTELPQPPPATDISPRKPMSYELRVIIWNTDEVILDEANALTGEKMSDIYVKGWITDANEAQSTDVHYRSLTGEGNFNWRFVYPFEYSPSEEKIIITKKESLFSWDETETKIPPKLYLQVWDADLVSADDFLGSLTLDLTNFVRGAKTSLSCTLDMATKPNEFQKMSIFTNNRVKGWWPFIDKTKEGETVLTGKVEAEIHLLTKEEAEESPAGLGRNEPDPLDKPNRPETSFMWFMNPFKTLRYVIWRNFKSKIIKGVIFLFLVLFFLLFVYAAPGLTARRIIDSL